MGKRKIEPVTELLTGAGYPCEYNRRNRWFKALSEIMESGLLTIKVSNKGTSWKRKEGATNGPEQWNIAVSAFERVRRHYTGDSRNQDVTPYMVLRVVGKFLQSPEIKEQIRSFVNLDLTCDRCGGQGYIRQFHYYCDGICFECYGSGYSPKKRIHVEIETPEKAAKSAEQAKKAAQNRLLYLVQWWNNHSSDPKDDNYMYASSFEDSKKEVGAILQKYPDFKLPEPLKPGRIVEDYTDLPH